MATEMKVAQELLYGASGLRVSNFKLFPGSSREVTVDQIAAEIFRSVNRVANANQGALQEEQFVTE